jgi:transposase
MLHLNSSCRYFYYNGVADMRKGSYSLSGLVRNEMHLDVLKGDVFVFIGKRANKIKLLQWDNDGFALFEKRLERGSFERPCADSAGHCIIGVQQLQYILQGVVLKSIKHHKRFALNG